MTYKTIGNTVAQWPDEEPLMWTMSEQVGNRGELLTRAASFDWTDLRKIADDSLLLLLKDELIERRHRLAINSLKTESAWWRSLFLTLQKYGVYQAKVAQIDWQFLTALHTVSEFVPRVSLDALKKLFRRNPGSKIFSPGLQLGDFPSTVEVKGHLGKKIDSILAKALTRSSCVEILSRCQEAYSDGRMDIGVFSFANLAFTIYCRPESYRLIRLSDLNHDRETDKFGIWIYPVKTGVAQPTKIFYDLPSTVGMLLLKQRMNVIETYGHFLEKEDHQKMALFPVSAIKKDKTAWRNKYANENFGRLRDSGKICRQYFSKIRRIANLSIQLTATALRHTVGTQLALAGCSARTIQAVLKHANDQNCKSYVDIAFHGLINDLSAAMEPAFDAHFPVIKIFRSKNEPLKAPKNALYNEDIETGQIIFQGECGKQIRCEHAPFTCYGCSKFIPCFDEDHQVNLNIAGREILEFSRTGTAYKVMVDRWTRVKYEIQMVVAACNLHQTQFREGGQ